MAGISLSTLQADIHTALQTWHETSPERSPLAYLQLYQQVRNKGAMTSRQATNQVLLDALDILVVKDKVEATLLRNRFLDGMMMHMVANQLNVGESTAYRKQSEALKHLAQIVQVREAEARQNYHASLEKRLSLPPNVKLFGVDANLNRLLTVLLPPDPVWIISIEGLGGMGKTALANSLVRQPDLISHFRHVLWVSAKQHDFLPDLERDNQAEPALSRDSLTDLLLEQLDATQALTQSSVEKQATLTRHLKDSPCLVVIDNLETVVDFQALLPSLRDWANPSQFILTSRYSLRTEPDVYCLTVDELPRGEALAFIRYEAETRGLTVLAQAGDDELYRIYEVVGGNPLALKLVVGQISILPLSQVLDSLKQARGKRIDALYTYIYWQAWHMLDPHSRQVLLVMPLAQDGTLDHLAAISQLEIDPLSQALEQLVALSLVQVGGGLEERRYIIHRLTETFLLTEAMQWKASN